MGLAVRAVIAGCVLALFLTVIVLAAQRQTWVAVTGPAGSSEPVDLVLEVGSTTWLGYGGVISVRTFGPLPVRLVGRATCRVYAEFVAPAGTMWIIRFLVDGSTRIEDWTGRVMDSGPGLTLTEPSDCPARAPKAR